ncbi:hypothetical protein NKJ16_07945 [Mesorhizobium sp. M0179]|uniref:hypothetical protein n=1 Tax=unclassified Mesorhizobium TaxID=325217 RepID=UPI0003CEC7C4|nr:MULTISPECIES: hypothetical protein [unclassified Mesorhizobium]ESX09592.1 hypothetical protein X768_17735 [Mesorhizobium sp. LSJC265A00]ESY06811.1 hypothetical protein X753_13120 [Mesorhizobium sp. LNJC399B00]WJI67666.1 hypothetical protein NLY36_23060 [Mesorhizobium sp. C399B]
MMMLLSLAGLSQPRPDQDVPSGGIADNEEQIQIAFKQMSLVATRALQPVSTGLVVSL